MPFAQVSDASAVEAGVAAYGAAPGGKKMMQAEAAAAEQAIRTGVYITWRSSRAGEPDCARVGPASRCFCGHAFSEHKACAAADPRPPACGACACPRFDYVPSRPEEVGMWWLPRRKGFDVRTWRAPCKCGHGHDAHDPKSRRCRKCGCGRFAGDFACLGCDGSAEDHLTCFETEAERARAGRPVGEAFRPLHDCSSALRDAVGIGRAGGGGGGGSGGGSGGGGGGGGGSPEEMLESGAISTQEYYRLVATAPTAGAVSHGQAAAPPARRTQQGPVPPTVRVMDLDLGAGQSTQVLTNVGAPIPVPGRDWSRPWEPARPAARGARGAATAPSGPQRGAASNSKGRA